MGGVGIEPRRSGRMTRLLGASALACVMAFAAYSPSASAQGLELADAEISADAEMLLQADTLVYDNDRNTVTAVGAVQIDYDGYRLVAQRVTYDRNTSRLLASGGVEIVDRDGTRIQAEQIDITDSFRDGFVTALRIETVDRTYFAADSAERRDGEVTTFNYGVYTACEPCEEKPDKPPIWRIKAQKIIWNGRTKTVRFEQARFEFFGFSLAALPAFEVADPTVKRKSGFLVPRFSGSNDRGQGIQIPYYLALSPTYDLTLFANAYTRQGFMPEAEWRQRFNTGEYSIRVAGIRQLDPGAFEENSVDRTELRGMVGTKGRFEINPRWTFGWNVLIQSDKNFSHTYNIEDYSRARRASEVFLTGIDDRNHLDLRFMRFQVQESFASTDPRSRHERQPWVLPSLDYSRTAEMPLWGGEFTFDVNAQGVHRDRFDDRGFVGQNEDIVRGIDGTSGRVTAEAEWKRTVIAPGGIALTPLLHGRGDAIGVNFGQDAIDGINAMAMAPGIEADIRSQYYRHMATAGLEARWPILFSTSSATHILEPMGQLFVRPNEPFAGSLGIPNEDAQSLVFDATTLFERDKFSGYDRIEGGTRANIGIRYSGTFGNGWATNAVFGQSFHLAGVNSFASPDLVEVGAFSGLETDRSDYVGQIGVVTPAGLSLTAGARFDEQNFDVRRTDVSASYASTPLALVGRYTYIEAQPDYGFDDDRHEVQVGGSARIHENWRVFGSGTYDMVKNVMVARSIGFAYDDECFDYRFSLAETQSRTTDEVNRSFRFRVSLRTLGDVNASTDASF